MMTQDALLELKKGLKELVREVVAEELTRAKEERQRECRHARSGTLVSIDELRCDDCGKLIDEEDLDEGSFVDSPAMPIEGLRK